jgi:hypothetical protein
MIRPRIEPANPEYKSEASPPQQVVFVEIFARTL